MKLQEATRITDRTRIIVLEIPETDILLAPLDEFDMMLIKECADSNSVADKLLALEMIARRIEGSTCQHTAST